MQKKHPALNVAMQNNTKQHFFEYGVAFWNAVKSAIFLFQLFFTIGYIFFSVHKKKHFFKFRFLNPNFFLFEL